MKGIIEKKIGLCLIAVLVGTVVVALFIAKWMRTDARLSEQAEQFLRTELMYRVDLQQHPYFYLLGLDAKDPIESAVLGRFRYHREWANALQQYNTSEATHVDQGLNQSLICESFSDTELKLLKQLQSSLQQSPAEFKHFVIGHQTVLQGLIQREQQPLRRLSDLIQQKAYVALVMPAQANSPNYSYVQQLQLLSLVHVELNSSQKLAHYEQQFNQVLRFTENRLSLVEKMLMQNWLSQLIDQIRYEQLQTSQKVHLTTLSPEQLGLKASLQNELTASYLMTQYLPYSSDIDRAQLKWRYLPQQTFNAIAQQYEVYWRLSETPYAELHDQFAAIQHETKPKWRFKNSLGHTLSQVRHPNFEKYLLMNHILNNKIIAFNVLNTGPVEIAGLNQNPEGRRFFQKAGQLCVDVPFPSDQLSELNLKTDSCVQI